MPSGVQETSNANPRPVNNGLSLTNGMSPRLIPLNVDFTVNTSVLVDLTQQQQSGQIGPLQTIYINNSGNAQPITVITDVLNQSITIPGGDSAILPIFLPNSSPKFTVNSTGGVIVPIAVMNFPLPAQVWGASFGNSYQSVNGLESLNVVDTALQALITNVGGAGPALDVNILSGGSSSSSEGTIVFIGTAKNNGNTALFYGGPAITNDYFVVTGFDVDLTPDAFSGGGEGDLTLYAGGFSSPTIFWAGNVYIPAAAPASIPAGVISIVKTSGINFPNNAVNNPPAVNWSGASLTQGQFNINIWGYRTTTPPTQ